MKAEMKFEGGPIVLRVSANDVDHLKRDAMVFMESFREQLEIDDMMWTILAEEWFRNRGYETKLSASGFLSRPLVWVSIWLGRALWRHFGMGMFERRR